MLRWDIARRQTTVLDRLGKELGGMLIVLVRRALARPVARPAPGSKTNFGRHVDAGDWRHEGRSVRRYSRW